MKINTIQKNIPEGWQKSNIEECFHNIGGTSLEEFVNETSPYKFISIGNYSVTGKYIDNGQRIELNKKTSDKLLKRGDLVMVLNDKTSIGTLIGSTILIDQDNHYIYNQRSERLIPKNKINSNYAWYFLNSNFRKTIFDISQGGTQIYVNFPSIKKLSLYIPSLSEQNRIVAVLETWDKAIEKLEKKIEIKKKIKKGLMQQLLTGKVRLAGFTDDWQIISLNSMGNIVSGGTPTTSRAEYWHGNIPWISSSDLVENNINDVYIHKFITIEAVKNSATKIIPADSIILVSRVGVGKMIVNKIELCTSQDFQSIIINNKNNYDSYFFAYLLMQRVKMFVNQNQGTSIKGFLKKDLETLAVKLPKTKGEQTKIANVLKSTDDEIALLEMKAKILKDQKKYLLNNLITGAIRTPEDLSIH